MQEVESMFKVYIAEEVLQGIFDHALQYGDKEAIGKLVGRPYTHVQGRYIDVWDYVPVASISTPVSVRYSPEAAEHLGEDLLTYHDTDLVVGWYHSHPGLGCFLSSRDVETQQRNYPEWYHCALVVDPYGNECKFFKIDEGHVIEVAYYIYRKK